MKKVGTQVELDLTNVLKMLDKAFVALKQQSKAWEDWLSVVRKALPTLGDVESMLVKVTGQLNQLKFTEEGATEAGKQEMEVRRRQITVLQAVRNEYRQQAREVEQTAKKEVRAVDQAAKAQERYSKSVGRSIKKIALWALGSATAYRLFMKLRRAVEEAAEEMYGSTQEWERAKIASDAFGKSLLLALMPQEKFLDTLDKIANTLERTSSSLVRYGATQQAVSEIIDRSRAGNEEAQATLMQYGRAIAYVHKTEEGQVLIQDRVNELVGEYNKLIEESQKETEKAAKTMEGFGKAVDDLRKRIDDYNKALYQITEQRFTDTLDAQRDYNEGIVELELARQRTVEDNAIAAARRLEDIQLDTARRMAAIERDLNKQLEAAKRDYGKEIRRAAEGLAQKLLDIERRYQDRLLDIERAYAYSIYDAISTRDATAALQAMRRRKDDLADAKRDRDRARSDAESDYARRIRDLKESLAEQERLARQSYQDQLEELRRSLAEQEEDYQISLRRREEDAELSYSRSMTDLQKAFSDRLVAIQAQTTLERANAKADYIFRENTYANHLAKMAAIYQAYQTVTTPSTPSFGMPSITPGIQQFAKGGMMIANQPTMALFGEAGPELVIVQPLPSTSQTHNIAGNVTHQINATISQSIAGMEGRIAGAVQQALADVIH